jgi:hypothetical protein
VHVASDGERGWVVGDGQVLATVDGGMTWTDGITYGRALAPWYYASWLLVLGLMIPVLRRPPRIETQRSVADMLLSDKPLEWGDADPLEFRRIALGLSRFLRNENTKPPLTIAISGAWGTGKTSLMNLLRADLAGHGFRPVWFNAWHHQKEEHLLASLLANVKIQAVPPWWRYEGVVFRARLLAVRGWRRWPVVLPLLLVFSVSAGFLVKDPAVRLSHVHRTASDLARDAGSSLTSLFSTPPPGSDRAGEGAEQTGSATLPKPLFVSFLGTLLGLLVGAYRGIKAFGVNPASLMASMSGSLRLRDLEAQTGFRHRFAAEFRDVTRALSPRDMLILIDDLDRCRPENVLEVLEAVNFLVSSGSCFVVIGMELDRVRRCVGLGFKDVADELLDDPESVRSQGPEADAGRRRRARFAQQYLEKLINIEVPIPEPTDSQARRLLVPGHDESAASPWARLLARAPAFARTMRPVAVVSAIVLGGVWFGLTRSWVEPPPPFVAGEVGSPGSPPTPTPERPPIPVPGGADGAAGPTGEPQLLPELIPPKPGSGPSATVFWTIALVLLAGAWALSRRPEVVVRDSEDFRAALEAWHPLIHGSRCTPRSVKKFLNRVRYYAMQQRPQREAEPLWRRALAWLPGRGAGADRADVIGDGGGAIPEQILVALSAIQHTNPEWLADDRLWKDFSGFMASRSLPGDLAERIGRFEQWPPLEKYRPGFARLSAGIRVS